MQFAINLEPTISNKLELAYQMYLSGQYKDAIKLFNDMTNEEEPIPKAIEGIILCQIALNDINNVQVNIYKYI